MVISLDIILVKPLAPFKVDAEILLYVSPPSSYDSRKTLPNA